MTGWVHKLYIGAFVAIGFILFVILVYWGFSYYNTALEERPFHADHTLLKPSGPVGHGLGIIGTLLILIGVFTYIGRKKNKFLPRVGSLKYWLEFHIFLCSVGPMLILFHTAFKFGGIVSISFWSMVAVVLSGVIGRFIYIQIPRTIQGRELSLSEIKEAREKMNQILKEQYHVEEKLYMAMINIASAPAIELRGGIVARFFEQMNRKRKAKSEIRKMLAQTTLSARDKKGVLRGINEEMVLSARINRLHTMQKLFKYWHVAHLPFALIMLIIMVIHVAITIIFGYRWIF
jgi:hypothetical protein